MRYAFIFDGVVVNTVIAEADSVQGIAGACTPVLLAADSPVGIGWLWSGSEFSPPLAPPVPPEPPEPEWAWYIDHGPFTDRLGTTATFAIDTSSAPGFVAIRADFARRKWIDLKDPRVIATVRYLAGQPLPGLGTLAQPLLTPVEADAVLTTPVQAEENLALRKLYFREADRGTL